MAEFQLTSPAFEDGGVIPAKYGYRRSNGNPPLVVRGTPPAASSLVVIMEDLDVEVYVGHNWYNWGVWNVDPERTRIPEDWSPESAQVARNDFDDLTYSGPHPDKSDHRYEFRLYALPIVLDLLETVSVHRLREVADDEAVARATLRGVYPAPD